jgi:phage tail sheath protein FI
MIVQQGSLNTTALVVPDLYVQIVAPQNLILNGVPTNVIGAVGTAQWGPIGTPVIVSTMADYATAFGAIQNRKYDMGTQVATAVQQGASNFRCVRVADGGEARAAATVLTNCLTLTAMWHGTLGNSATVTVGTGSAAGSYRAVVGLPGRVPETFDNITGSGNAFWVNLANAINNGQGPLRPASQIITAAAGVGTTSPASATYTLSGGADGASSASAATIIGSDTAPRTGMYALRGQGCSIGLLADLDTAAQWTVANTFGLAEGIYMILTGPASESISSAVAAKVSAGLDSYASKLMLGDWIYWNDPTAGIVRLVSPQGFVAGRLANLSPEQSSLNKPLYGVVGSQKSGIPGGNLMGVYSNAELQTMFLAGIDVIANPQPGGAYWGVRAGHNSSSNAAVSGDNYTRMTNYIAATLNGGMGRYIGRPINLTLMQQVKATLLDFLRNMQQQGMLATGIDGAVPFAAICDASNNPATRTALGYLQADVQVRYQAIAEKFIINLEGGQTVAVARQTTPSGPVAA